MGVADTDDQLKILGEKLREVRASTGKSLKELEKIAATSDSSLSRYLSGTVRPPWSVVERLCRAAQRDPAELRDIWEQARPRPEQRVPPSPDVQVAQAPFRRIVTRRRVLAVAAVVVLAVGVTVLALRPWAGHGQKYCPWQYIVTDGDPAPVIIADRADPGRHHIGSYVPSQIFSVPEPVQTSGKFMRTADGWITAGDWIRRYPGPCTYRR